MVERSSSYDPFLRIEPFLTKEYGLLNLICLYNPDRPWTQPKLQRGSSSLYPPLYYASKNGLRKPVKMLLDKGGDVNAQSGRYGNALQAALDGCYQEVIKVLLDKGKSYTDSIAILRTYYLR